MKSLTLFRKTFQRTQQALQQVELIKNNALPQARRHLQLQNIARIMMIMNSIEYTAMDLQSNEVEHQLTNFGLFLSNRKMSARYSYDSKGFEIVNNEPLTPNIAKFSIHLRSQGVQKIDHPAIRQTLYFHQLKNIDQYVKLKYPRQSPRFIREIHRRNAQNSLLDNKNPLGLPIKAPPLQLILYINEKFATQLSCRYGYINLKTIRLLKKSYDNKGDPKLQIDFLLNGMSIPRQVQKIFYSLCKDTIGLDEPQLFLLHKIAYIGGRVQQIQFLCDMLEFYSTFADNQ